MAGLESDGHIGKEAVLDAFKDVAELVTGDYNQTKALASFMKQLEADSPQQKKVILSHSMATKSAMVMAEQYPVILFQPRGISKGSLRAVAVLRQRIFKLKERPSEQEVLKSLEENATIIKGRESIWNRTILLWATTLPQIAVLHTATSKAVSLIDDHKADIIAAGAANLLGPDLTVTLHSGDAPELGGRVQGRRVAAALRL